MKISIIIPTCQGARYIGETLDSIARQSRVPDEIVVSIDQSTDDTREAVESFRNRSGLEVHILDHARAGISANYFNALSHADGDIVIVSDHDDIWLPQKCQRIAAEFERQPDVSIVSSDSRIVTETLEDAGSTLRGGTRKSAALARKAARDDCITFLAGMPLDAHTLAFRAQVIQALVPVFDADIEQFWFEEKVAVAAMSIGRLAVIAEALTLYRQHGSQQVGYREVTVVEKAKPRQAGRLPKIRLLESLLEEGRGRTLFDETDRIQRLEKVRAYLAFCRTREFQGNGWRYVRERTCRALRGDYHRFTQGGILSLAKDLLLALRA